MSHHAHGLAHKFDLIEAVIEAKSLQVQEKSLEFPKDLFCIGGLDMNEHWIYIFKA